MYRSISEELTREAVQIVNRGINRVYNPVLTDGDETITAEKLNLWASEIRKYSESIDVDSTSTAS